MKRIIFTSVMIVICFLLQSTLLQYASFGGIIPNLLIIIIASFGFMNGEKTGILVGFVSGLLMDLFFGNLLGYYALIMMYIGFINGLFRGIFYPEDIKLPLILILASDFSYNVICYILMFLFRGKFDFIRYFSNIIFPEMIYTIVVACVLYPILLLIHRKLETVEKEGAQKFG